MRRLHAVLAGAILAAIVAPAAIAGPQANQRYAIEIRTVPAFAGLRFSLGGQTVKTHGNGLARIFVNGPGTYTLAVPSEQRSSGGKQVRFARWLDDTFANSRTVVVRRKLTRLVAGFTVGYPVGFRFVDRKGNAIDPARIQSVTLGNSLGQKQTFSGTGGRRLLVGSRVARLLTGLSDTDILYSVERVMVDGMDVVNRGQQRFYPRKTPSLDIQLLFFAAHIQSRDGFFHFPIGSAVRLEYPNGKVERYRLGSGAQVLLPALPRGQYKITVEGPGLSITRPVDLSRDQEVDLAVLSYLDLAAAAVVIAFFALGLLLAGRPSLRSTLRDRIRQRPPVHVFAEGFDGPRSRGKEPTGPSPTRSVALIQQWLEHEEGELRQTDTAVSDAELAER